MKKKRSIWPELATILLVVSLIVNAVFAVMYVKLSRETKQTIEQLEMKVEEYSSLMQERQDAVVNEGSAGDQENGIEESSAAGTELEDKEENGSRLWEDDLILYYLIGAILSAKERRYETAYKQLRRADKYITDKTAISE